jgi:hypothetical protein
MHDGALAERSLLASFPGLRPWKILTSNATKIYLIFELVKSWQNRAARPVEQSTGQYAIPLRELT